MNIKFRARLSAYSRIDPSTEQQGSLPPASVQDSGNVVGVANAGQYTLFPKVTPEMIDDLFKINKETK